MVPVLAVAALVVVGCSTRGIRHRVLPGETLSQIGAAYGVSYRKIAGANHLRDPSRIYPGQSLLIPGAERTVEVPPSAGRRSARRNLVAKRRSKAPSEALKLRWPVAGGRVTSLYGPRWGRFHDGIDIGAAVGSPVRAAAGGEVVFDGVLSGYGNVVIIRHSSGFSTVYAHNQKHFVDKGQWVRRGDHIANVGRSGRVTGPNLHFEVRYDNVARDPMRYLPSLPRSGRASSGKKPAVASRK